MAHIETLPDECLLLVLDWLSPKQLFEVRVNVRMKRLADEKMRTKIRAIELWQSKRDFSECTHLNTITRDQVLVLNQFKYLHVSLQRINFLSILSKCSSVRSIDFGCSQLADNLLLEMFSRCPQLECLKISVLMIPQEEWDQVMSEVGHRLVHFAKGVRDYWMPNDILESVREADSQRLATVAGKCPNIKLVNWLIQWPVTGDLISAIKSLPNDCWVTLSVNDDEQPVTGQVFEDVVDEYDTIALEWPSFGRRVDRLSSLTFFGLYLNDDPIRGVEFTRLKKLEFGEHLDSDENMACFLASRFPLLEEFNFYSAGLDEDDYQRMFQKVATVKKLTIVYDYYEDEVPKLPGLSIYHLNNLETLIISISDVPEDWQPDEEFFKQIEQYVDGICSLKKLTIETECALELITDLVDRLMLKQSRVQVKCYFLTFN